MCCKCSCAGIRRDVEIIVGNDHSIDGTTQIINELEAKYPGRIRHVCREKNIGACENLKQMVIEAQGEFIAHLDGDDFWGQETSSAAKPFLRLS
ncbi:MAG: glycosyltransferase [Burkholderiales bacterium]|nr:glycosyltransferase [Burkholderiales bacterium]